MNSKSILPIISCAFQICYYYCLKCLAPPIQIKSYSLCYSSGNYDTYLESLLGRLKYLISKCDLNTDNCDLNSTYNNDNSNIIYSLKLKEIRTGKPLHGYKTSEIYVDKEKKTFNIYTQKGFIAFPLHHKSIVKTNN